MKLSSRRFKFLGISILALLIFIPLIVFGDALNGYKSLKNGGSNTMPVFHYADNSLSSVAAIGTCISNTSGNDYFIPTRTLNEWNAFFSHQPSGVTLTTCCGDGACNGGENCSNCPTECGVCTCSSFTYSNWSGCCNGTQSRSITSKSPANCTGGSPVTSQSCSSYVSGCETGTCRNGTIYLNSGYCSGSSITQNNVCMASSVPNSSCIYGGSSSSQYYVPSSGCSYSVACGAISGCPSGSSCRSASVYLANASCGGGVSSSLTSVCIANTDANGTCLSYNSLTSIIYTTGSGCTY